MNRKTIIDKIVINNIQSILDGTCEDDTLLLDYVLRYGFKGYNNFTNNELTQEYFDIFGEKIMDNEVLANIVKQDIKETACKHIKEAINKWGMEATEEKIKQIYKNHPKIQEIMSEEYRRLLK